MKKAIVIAFLCLPFLTGCSLFQKFQRENTPLIPADMKVSVDPRALELCRPLVPLAPSKSASGVLDHYDILINIRSNAEIYRECAKKQADSVDLIKQLTNKKDPK